MEQLSNIVKLFRYDTNSLKSLLASEMSQTQSSSRSYPLVNHTALINLSPQDFIKPGQGGLVLSTLPMFQVLINIAAFTIWIIVILYFWKIIYYQVDDPYATTLGSYPPNFQRSSKSGFWEKVYNALDLYDNVNEKQSKNHNKNQ